MKKVIEVENLTKKYGGFLALDNVSFDVMEHEIVAFLGPNGAGKTTTMRILSGYIPATDGSAKINEYDIFDDSLKVREQIGYLPEIPPLYPDMTVSSYLKYVAKIKQVPGHLITEKLAKVLDKCGLEEVKAKLISKLSKGYRQRVGIAQAIIHEPSVIILDEPTVGLDPNQVIEIRALIKSLVANASVLLSTHILSEAEMICDRVIIIDHGKLIQIGSLEDLRNLRENISVRLVLESYDESIEHKIRSIPGVISILVDDDSINIVCRDDKELKNHLVMLAANNSWNISEMASNKISLEEVFKFLTVKEKV